MPVAEALCGRERGAAFHFARLHRAPSVLCAQPFLFRNGFAILKTAEPVRAMISAEPAHDGVRGATNMSARTVRTVFHAHASPSNGVARAPFGGAGYLFIVVLVADLFAGDCGSFAASSSTFRLYLMRVAKAAFLPQRGAGAVLVRALAVRSVFAAQSRHTRATCSASAASDRAWPASMHRANQVFPGGVLGAVFNVA